jgi:hypothetical protein
MGGGKWFPSFFLLPIISLAIVTVPVLCIIQYCLACNNNNGDIHNGRVRGEVKKKGKQTVKQTNKQKTDRAKEINRERY